VQFSRRFRCLRYDVAFSCDALFVWISVNLTPVVTINPGSLRDRSFDLLGYRFQRIDVIDVHQASAENLLFERLPPAGLRRCRSPGCILAR
jgi:hypothetical protein